MIILCILNSMSFKKQKPNVIIFKVTLVRDAQYIKDVEECIEDVYRLLWGGCGEMHPLF